MTSLFQKGKIYERWSFSFSSAVGSCTTNPPSSPFGFDNVGWKILPGGCRFSGGEMTGKFRKVASHSAPEPAFGLFLNLPEGSAPGTLARQWRKYSCEMSTGHSYGTLTD